MRANTQRPARGARDKRGGREKDKTGEQRHEICGRKGMGQGTQGKQDGHFRDFQEGKQGI